MPDKKLSCKFCSKEFVWTESEQKFYAQKGFQEPKRCSDCRKKKREEERIRTRQYEE